MKKHILAIFIFAELLIAQPNYEIQQLANEFWNWRKTTQPCSGDDVLRIERPDNWVPDYSASALNDYSTQYKKFKTRILNLNKSNWTRSDSIDFLLLRSAIERVNWELKVLKHPSTNPEFYVYQTLGAVYELLLIHSPMTNNRIENIIKRLNSIPKTIKDAKENLVDPIKPVAKIALLDLQDIRNKLYQTRDGLFLIVDLKYNNQLSLAIENAANSLEDYYKWIDQGLEKMNDQLIISTEDYKYFLKNIALIPFTPEEILLMGDLEWNRAVTFDTYEKIRNIELAKMEIFSSSEEQISQSRKDEEAIRKFLVEKNIMSIPDWVKHYINKPMPPHIKPLSYMGVVDDLTSETRLNEDGVSYIPEPSWNMSFFRLATAKDPRPIIIHEGIPGHYFHLVRSWANPNPLRRRFVDSGPIEGIGTYVEELLLQLGLFDSDRPGTRETIYSFMRLRALRVNVDVNLALGNYTIEQAGEYLASTVPMDLPTAIDEAGFFAYNPGQAITYQIGKTQIIDLISDAKIVLGDKFDLKDYHDYMMINANVPIALQRWEYLGLKNEIYKLWPID
jgi:hypothetical protein